MHSILEDERIVSMRNTQDNIFSSKTLTYFLQLAETMSYTKAAKILGITQPALTQQIKKLERTVGAPLFYSVGKKLHLSDAGYTMLDATHQINEVLNQAADEIQMSTGYMQGEINIGILSTIEDEVFLDFIIEYYKENPQITVSIRSLSRTEIWECLEDNTIDFAIMYLPDNSIKNWKPYDTKRIVNDELMLVHQNSKLDGRKHVKLKDSLENSWVTYPREFYINEFLRESFKNEMLNVPRCVAYLATPKQMIKFATKTGVSTVIPATYIAANQLLSECRVAHFEPELKFDLSFVFRRGKNQIPRVSEFMNDLTLYLSDKGYFERLEELKK